MESINICKLQSFFQQAEKAEERGKHVFNFRKNEHTLSVSLPSYSEGELLTYINSKKREQFFFKIRVDSLERKIYSTDFNYDDDSFMDNTKADKLVSEYPQVLNILEIFFQNQTKIEN